MTRGLIIGAARSGSGKTSVTIGLMRALRRQGLTVAGAKSGPDYIDPGFHAAATGRPGVNLDSWAMAPGLLDSLLSKQVDGADALIVESAMGLFDGVRKEDGRSGAAADLARHYGLPVLLVLDISGQSQTAAAIAHGFATFDPGVKIAAVVLNQVASERHEAQARAAIEASGIPVLGAIYRNPDMALPERHLGLVQASEHAALEAFIERLADTMEKSLNLDAVLRAAGPVSTVSGADGHFLPPPGQRIAIAQDAAFSFVYPHAARHWREVGAELVPFSPLADDAPDASCDACWLPGGYPELHAGQLAAAANFKAGLVSFAETRPVHGECGGYMVLGKALEDAEGVTHEMSGLLSHVTSFARRKINLGYREARLLSDCPLGKAGETVRGHEFHYSRLTEPGSDEPLADLADAMGNARGHSGGRRGRVTGTYFHAIARG
ncbi:cobyrinate a,c-diamide synthase [Chelativorans sp. YIM 93263]|uniref:cobyrinate a,c-diamide synthase n=1 Tax=Chelativorans sp. YIM 93263 TaxID=2906648 RepID=UPI002379829F|nr:cobyrinate a,c-diamide synthase [Chelativorans sp. YIM 93263]